MPKKTHWSILRQIGTCVQIQRCYNREKAAEAVLPGEAPARQRKVLRLRLNAAGSTVKRGSSMERLAELLKTKPAMYLATVEGCYPRVRPVNHYMIHNGYLYLALCKDKEAYKQLLDNTNLELCSLIDSDKLLRIQGTVNFDRSAETYAKAYEEMPDLKEAYREDSGKHLALIYLDHMRAVLFDRTDDGEILIQF